jgi:hypothetical protein
MKKRILSFWLVVALCTWGAGAPIAGANGIIYPYFFYNSPAELWAGITTSFDEKSMREIWDRRTEWRRESFSNFISSLESDGVWVPAGSTVRLENRFGSDHIVTLHSSYQYYEPWISYYAVIEDYDTYISTMYIKDDLVEEANERGSAWFIRAISPNAPNIHNSDEFPDYEKIEEIEIVVNQKIIPALIVAFDERTYPYIHFIYSNMLVVVYADSSILDNDGLADLSFVRYKGEDNDGSIYTPSAWANDLVRYAIAENLVPASLQSKYTQPTTRAEFCALATALYEKIKGEITERITFADIDDVNVEKMAAIGVVSGVGGNRFDPDANLTREQAAVMLAQLAVAVGKPFDKQAAARFADNSSIASWAIERVGQVQAAGIMSGIGNNMFAPKQPYTREQSIITVFLMLRYIQY